ncbi:transporter [Paraburkholderia megapolitana]|uniref:Uncharacterized conserved protein n=1 Tax=Paraburkholderia megapolitana TaxID=420953 RepID=A0A1I3KJG9_9BURK|nr:transporter [Paraburkholderia megapolitana]QDQ80368.1 transporter [Paraburkholderia megapolitana]SFI72633.1 Uncharacterized conserved protein [Paraburkholderia megapolitana]
MEKRILRSFVVMAGFLVAAKSASAIDIYPADYTILPPGTTLALGYLGFKSSHEFNLDGVGDVPGSSLNQTIGIARVLHYSQIAGIPVAYQVYLPFANLSNFKVGGASPQTNNGMGDITFGFTAFLVNRPDPVYGTTVGITPYVSLPTGKYDVNRSGPGAGAVTFTPQLGVIQGLGHNFYFDGAFDVAVQTGHSNAGQQISVHPSIELQTYLRYQISAASSVSFGYAGYFGGKQYINDAYNGQETSSSELRLYASHMLTPTWQVAGMVGKAVANEGGFKNSYSVQIRVMKIF